MVNEDSPIIDFYPTSFDIDMNGKRMAWQGVALLPFIDEKRLLDAVAPEYPKLTEDENRRNRWGNNIMYVSDQHALYPLFESLYGKKRRNEVSFQAITIPGMLVHMTSSSPHPFHLPKAIPLPAAFFQTPIAYQDLPMIPPWPDKVYPT